MKKLVCVLIIILTFGITYGAVSEETAYSLSVEDKLSYIMHSSDSEQDSSEP